MKINHLGPALVVMAAGAARRYRSMKALAPAGPNGEALMEYSIHDAFAAGFSKAVIVIRSEFEPELRNTFLNRASVSAPIEVVYQEFNTQLPNRWRDSRRDKPWGTAHAVLCAAEKIDRRFAVINADDFYGRLSRRSGRPNASGQQ
jgi:NDP-sugar pyrophosphorylase family protein